MHCIRKLAEEALKSELLSSTPTYKVSPQLKYCNSDNIFLGEETYNATSGKTTGILPCLEPRRLLKEHLCETKRLHFASVTITILNDCHTHLINNDCPNIKLFLRNPVAQSTDGARGKIGFRCSLRSFSHHSAIFFHLLTQVWSTCMGGDMGRTIGDCCGDRYKTWMS